MPSKVGADSGKFQVVRSSRQISVNSLEPLPALGFAQPAIRGLVGRRG